MTIRSFSMLANHKNKKARIFQMLSWQGKSGLSAVLTLKNENNIMIASTSPV